MSIDQSVLDKFEAVVESQRKRIMDMKAQDDFIDYSKLDKLIIGVCGGDGIGPMITGMAQHALEDLLRGHGHAASDIIHITDYVVERGSDKHIAYAASKAALDNMTRSFARKLAPEIKVNAIAPSLIMFNEGDDEAYRQQALDKSLMKIAPGEKEISDLIDYLFTSRYVTGRSFAVDGGRPLR